jgi:hypothetical protein
MSGRMIYYTLFWQQSPTRRRTSSSVTPVISKSLHLPVAPLAIFILPEPQRKTCPKNLVSLLFASPSTGGAVNLMRRQSPLIPVISFLEAEIETASEYATFDDLKKGLARSEIERE